MADAERLPRRASRTTPERREGQCNVLFFFMTADFNFGHLGGHIALAVQAGFRVMPTALFPLLALVVSLLSPSKVSGR